MIPPFLCVYLVLHFYNFRHNCLMSTTSVTCSLASQLYQSSTSYSVQIINISNKASSVFSFLWCSNGSLCCCLGLCGWRFLPQASVGGYLKLVINNQEPELLFLSIISPRPTTRAIKCANSFLTTLGRNNTPPESSISPSLKPQLCSPVPH